jgi:hypothetical protein
VATFALSCHMYMCRVVYTETYEHCATVGM